MTSRRLSLLLLATFPAFGAVPIQAEEAPKTDPRYPFRTESANPELPWYLPKPLEFPPHHSDRRIGGELVSVDFIHRTGQFRATRTGELVDFTMPPYGAMDYLNAEAEVRDVPLGTFFLFFLNQDSHGGFTRLAMMQDQYTMDASHSFSYRLNELKLAEGKLETTKQSIPKKQPDLGAKELLVKDETRVWKSGQQIKFADLQPGDELLYSVTGKTAESPGWCTDIWVGAETHQRVTEERRQKFAEFIRARGLPGWIEKTEGNKITITFFSGDTRGFKQTWGADFALGKEVKVCVANDELRTWNPPVDGERGQIVEVQSVPIDGYGCSGLRITTTVTNMLEGFRRGRIVRVFGPGWKVKDQFYGESLMGYGFGRLLDEELKENPAKEYPEQFPFRTEFGNEAMSWFRLKGGQEPPPFAERVVYGELGQVDVAAGTGQFRTERTGEVVNFTMVVPATVRFLNAKATLADLPAGTRCRFHLFQDDKGAFTRATYVGDDFSSLAGHALTYRMESLRLAEGKLRVAWQMPEVKDYNGDMQRPPDIGRSELRLSPETRVWKSEQQVKAADLQVGDALLFNLTSEQPGSPARCTDIWIGADTHKLVTERQAKKLTTARK